MIIKTTDVVLKIECLEIQHSFISQRQIKKKKIRFKKIAKSLKYLLFKYTFKNRAK
jgi:hypothetical protein